jgi:hypothetical protein
MYKNCLETRTVSGMQKYIPRIGTNCVNILYGATCNVSMLFVKVGGGHICRSQAVP